MPTNRVFVSGVWSLFHVGHVRILKRAKALGDYLIVSVNSDKKTANYKRKPIWPEDIRLEIIQSIKYVDEAFICDSMDLRKDILDRKADIIVHGDDCTRERYLKQICLSEIWLKENNVKLTLLPYTPDVSTTNNFINHGEKYRELQRRGSC